MEFLLSLYHISSSDCFHQHFMSNYDEFKAQKTKVNRDDVYLCKALSSIGLTNLSAPRTHECHRLWM